MNMPHARAGAFGGDDNFVQYGLRLVGAAGGRCKAAREQAG